MKNRIDRFLKRFISKKLMVFIIGSVFLFLGKIMPDQWVYVASIYIGGQAIVDMMKAWRNPQTNEFIG